MTVLYYPQYNKLPCYATDLSQSHIFLDLPQQLCWFLVEFLVELLVVVVEVSSVVAVVVSAEVLALVVLVVARIWEASGGLPEALPVF